MITDMSHTRGLFSSLTPHFSVSPSAGTVPLFAAPRCTTNLPCESAAPFPHGDLEKSAPQCVLSSRLANCLRGLRPHLRLCSECELEMQGLVPERHHDPVRVLRRLAPLQQLVT